MTAARGSDWSDPASPGRDQPGHERPDTVLPEPGRPEGARSEPSPERLRRRLDAVFGDVLPDVTRDEAADPDPADARTADTGSAATGPGAAGADPQDAWLRANRPPHHDRD